MIYETYLKKGAENIMNMHVLRDKQGRKIGVIETDPKGVQTIRNASGKKLGTYDPKTNKTRDAIGRVTGSGNLLTALLT